MANFNLVDQTNLFKINYYKKSENLYNSANVLNGRMRKRYDFTGRQRFVSNPFSFSGGVGSGRLPQANAGQYEGSIIESKKVYARAEIDRESIKASANNAGAFVQATKETVKKTVESHMRNDSRILFGTGDGLLGRGDGTGANVAGNGSVGTPYVVEIPASEFKLENWEEKDFVQMVVATAPEGGTAITNLLEIVAVDRANRLISLVGTSPRLAALTGVGPLAATDEIAMQRSYNNDPVGLKQIADLSAAGAGTLYGINIQRRWSMTVDAAGGAGITVDRINGLFLDVERVSGWVPNMIMVGFAQYRNLLALMEDQKVYNLPNRNIKGNLSFQGIEFMTSRGPVGVFVDRFVEDDTLYALNDNYMERHHRPDFGWFDDDGTVFLRMADDDAYEARYGGYYQNYIIPTMQGVIRGLAV